MRMPGAPRPAHGRMRILQLAALHRLLLVHALGRIDVAHLINHCPRPPLMTRRYWPPRSLLSVRIGKRLPGEDLLDLSHELQRTLQGSVR